MLLFKISKKSLFLLALSGVLLAAGAYVYLKKRRKAPELPTLAANTNQSPATTTTNFFFDLETIEGLSNTDNIKPGIAHSGKRSCDLSGGKEFGISVVKRLGDAGLFPIKRTGASIWVYPLSNDCNVVLTASISNSKNETVFWDGKSSERMQIPANTWTKINALYNFPAEKLAADDVLQINLWNKGKTDILVDDLEIVYGEGSERRGDYSGIDANLFYEKRFVATRNKPPFPPIYLTKLNINNNDSTQLVPENANTAHSANEEYLVGNFIDDKNNLDELLYIKNDKQSFFMGYDPEDQKFQVLGEAYTHMWSPASRKFAGDFNNDGKTDVFLTNETTWLIYEFKNNRWNVISKGGIDKLKANWFGSKSAPFVSDMFSEDGKDALVFIENGACYTLQLDKAAGELKEGKASLNVIDSALFSPTVVLYQGNYTRMDKSELLRYDTEWRFDLKLIEKTASGYSIIGTLDFEGFRNDYNPKYYEFLKIIPGKFTNNRKTSVLTIMCNCADPGFDGKRCKTFENLNYLPNSVQLYTVKDIGLGK